MDKKRVVIALSIAAVLVTMFVTIPCRSIIGLIGMTLFAGLAQWEFYGMMEAGGFRTNKAWGLTAGIAFVAGTWFFMNALIPGPLLWSLLIAGILLVLTRTLFDADLRRGLETAMATMLGLIYVPLLWSFVVRLLLTGDFSKPGWAAFYVILCTKISDSGGYFFGTRFGKHKLAPVVSPKKSWEGLGGGVVFCLAANLVWTWLSKGHLNGAIPLPLGHALVLSVLFPLVGTLGDLVESLFKRAVGVKDSNTMVYGLGGILDMIDSILFTAPMLYVYVVLFL